MPPFPDVPVAPGVPAVPRGPGNTVTNPVAAATGDTTSVTVTTFQDKWAIYDTGGKAVLASDSFVQFHYGKDADTPTYPLEDGSLAQYNKVQLPYTGTVRVSRTGTSAQRRQFCVACDDLVDSLDSFSVVTPDKSYTNVTFLHVEYDRSAEQGAGMIMAELHFRQVRGVTSTVFSNTVAPSGADKADGGNVQAQAPTARQQGATGP